MKQKNTTRNIVLTGLLLALEIIFQVLGNYLKIGLVNLNLTLVTIVLGAVLCGPMSAAILGFFNGIMALFAPDTLAIFMPLSPYGTVVVCLAKCTVAGIVASYLYKLLANKNKFLAVLLASIAVPVINTGLFSIGALIFFRPFLESGVGEQFPNIGAFLIFGIIGLNFLVEVASTAILGPTISLVLLSREAKTAVQS